MSELAPTSHPPAAPLRDEGLSPDAFFYENEGARKRAEARRRAVKRWLHRLLKRSPDA